MDAFVYRQKSQGAKIRFNEDRAGNLDYLLLNRLFLDGHGDLFDLDLQLKWLELPLPSEISLQDTQELGEMMEMDSEKEYWQSVMGVQNKSEEIDEDVEATLKGKSIAELDELSSQIESMGNAEEFWTKALKEIQVRKAHQLLGRYEKQIIARRVEFLKSTAQKNNIELEETITTKQDLLDALEKTRQIAIARKLLKTGKSDKEENNNNDDDNEGDSLDDNEEPLIEEEPVKTDMSLEKPRYFNRVVKGFEWTKYNQKHYSNDNPPPKIIKGYRFNIFYPELDATKTPTYRVIKGEDKETCVLVFKAPEKYRDIAFRIANKPWDKSTRRRSGFKSKFENGCLQLHFRFKRVFYRR
ncbi:hypothetical protein TRVA0_010S00848 [Trichomonascus vanleenenianus]|uniref:uncharacterized protein n=1 Tax=Trichomonascus vanleenenianus TaxID=2268995 RepID=UPI003ECB288A